MVSLLARDLALTKLVWWGRRYNKSLDRSAFSGLLIDNLRLSRLRARPVNSTVIAPRTYGKICPLNRGLNGFAFSARLGADGTCVVGAAL